MKKELLIEIEETRKALIRIITLFPNDQFNKMSSEGSWTPAQVTDHISRSLSGVADLLYANTKPTKRDAGEKSAAVKKMFLDFNLKMKSPEFVLPGNDPLEKDQVMEILGKNMEKLKEATETLDISATTTVFELPGFGEFTRAEWITFGIYHTRRHTAQLSNIYEKLSMASALP